MQALILTLMIPTMTLVFAAVFVALWWQDRARTYILAYAAWFLAVAAGLLAQALFVTSFGPPQIVAFHLVSTTGLIALLWGVARRDERRVPLVLFIAMTCGTAVVLWFAAKLGNSGVLIMAQNFNAALLFAMGAYGKWTAGHRHLADRWLLGALVALAAYSMFRPSVTVLVQSQMTMEEYHTSILLTVNMVMTAVLCMLISICLLATILSDNMSVEREASTLDALSGLPNRAAFEKAANALVARAREEERSLSLIVGDIDHFKLINDQHGHATGDRVIAGFGQLIARKIRDTDIAGRIGGEEFCVLVWSCDLRPAAGLANRIRQAATESSMRDDDTTPSYTASFGVAQARDGESYAQLFERADSALYQAKGSGRNRVFLHGEGLLSSSDATIREVKSAYVDPESSSGDRVIDFIGRTRNTG